MTSVSVAMATCNGANFVDAQLESLASQTRLPDELVVCDDASSDDTLERLRGFATRAPFEVRIESNDPGLGTTANFDRAASLCSSEIVFLADQDDIWLPEKIETLAAVLDHNLSVGAVFCNGTVVDATNLPLEYDLWTAIGFDEKERAIVRDGRSHEVFVRHVVAAGTTFAFRGSYAPLVYPFPTLRSAHDAWVACLISAVSKVEIVEQELIRYRLHGGNQLGLRKLGLLEQFSAARRQIELEAFDYAAQFFEQAGERLREHAGSDFNPRQEALDAIDAKAAHSRVRDAMPASLVGRIPVVWRELRSRGYARYAYGWKSLAQDLFLR